jgi:hypothetical protein
MCDKSPLQLTSQIPRDDERHFSATARARRLLLLSLPDQPNHR